MTNEEKILSMLEKIQADIETLKSNGVIEKVYKPTPEEQLAVVENLADMLKQENTPKRNTRDALLAMSQFLTDEEKDELGRYFDAEQRIKEKVVDYRNKLWQEEMKNSERQNKIVDDQKMEAHYA
ncbi:MAG: hypothetical protein IJS81_09010 [Selenomonadaceae bacterium]|nr:hypothetical protein [Selenomonadaceae bacterium]